MIERFLFSQAECCQVLDISRQNFGGIGIDPVREEGGKKLFDIRAVVQARLSILTERSDSEKLDLTKERALLARSQRRKIDIETEVLEKSLLPADQVEEEWKGLVFRFRSKMLALPARAASQLMGMDQAAQEEFIRDLISEALDELSTDDGPRPGAKGGGASTKTDGKRMGGPGKKA